MATLDQVRKLALALPEVTEQDHQGMIFATVPDHDHVRIMVDEPEILAAVAGHPAWCGELYWGRRLACVVVEFGSATRELLRELLTEAWLRKAPTSLARDLPPPRSHRG